MLVVGSICPSLPTCCKCTCNKRKADELRGNYDVFRIKLHYWKIQRNCRRTWSCLSKFQSKQLFSFRLQCLKVGGSFFSTGLSVVLPYSRKTTIKPSRQTAQSETSMISYWSNRKWISDEGVATERGRQNMTVAWDHENSDL